MILAPVFPVPAIAAQTPVTIRLIGTLDNAFMENFSSALASLAQNGAPTLLVMVRDLVIMRGEHLDRFLAALGAYQSAGRRVMIDETPTWRKLVRGRGPTFEPSTPVDGLRSRRQIIICHSLDRREKGAA